MTGKDVIKLLLLAYGFKKIKITTYRGQGNAQGYEIHAKNDDDYYYDEVNCEGLMFNIVHIIDWMNQLGFEPTYSIMPGQEYSVKELLRMKL